MVISCTAPVDSGGLCRKHYMRKYRHGSTEQTRPADWGARESHQLYKLWCSIKRNRSDVTCAEWLKDFWKFVRDVGAQPEGYGRVTLMPMSQNEKMGPGNFYWSTPIASTEVRRSKAEHMKAWRAAKLEANEDYFRDADYQKRYGVTLEWYNQKLAEQGGNCAICKHPETTKIRGTVIRLAVDHCHDTGVARALLCKECNQAIGLMHHDPVRLAAAASYVTHYSNFSK
jgi:hypothetical protein